LKARPRPSGCVTGVVRNGKTVQILFKILAGQQIVNFDNPGQNRNPDPKTTMTFYGVIAAILFLGACRQVVVAIEQADAAGLVLGITLMLFVFNDALFTSAHVETPKDPVDYDIALKIIDLFNFVLLVIALVVVNPGENVFLSGGKHLPKICAEWQFWVALAIYWSLINVWTTVAGIYERNKYPRWLRFLSIALVPLLALAGLLSVTSTGVMSVFRWVMFGYVFVYILIVRPLAVPHGPLRARPTTSPV